MPRIPFFAARLRGGGRRQKIEGMAENSCAFVVPGLLEVRVPAGFRSVDDVNAMIFMIADQVATLRDDEKFVIAADWRAVQVMSPETAAHAKHMLLRMNPRLVRSAILTLPENPTTNLQVIRLVREAENEQRRLFTAPHELQAWLSEVLSREALARLRTFLAERSVAA